MTTRIAIIGAGVVGCATAKRAMELGNCEVTVIEKSTPASGSSGRSAGVYNTQTLRPLDIAIRARSRDILYDMEKRYGLPLARIGNLRIAASEEDVPKLQAALDYQREVGVEDSRLLSQKELSELVPDLVVDDVFAALYGPNDGHLDGHLLCTALSDDAKANGAKFLLGTDLTGYERRGKVHVLKTSKGDIEADIVVNAAGAWAPKIGDMLGHRAAVRPEIHQVVMVKLPESVNYTVPMCNFYMPGQSGEGIYFRQDGPGAMIAGLHTYDSVPGHAVDDPENFSPPDGDEEFLRVAEMVSERLKVEGLGFREGWFGLYPLSADGLFQIGPYEADPSVIVAAGLGGVGMVSGPALGAVVAEWALKGKPITVPQAEQCLPDRPSLAGL